MTDYENFTSYKPRSNGKSRFITERGSCLSTGIHTIKNVEITIDPNDRNVFNLK